MEHQLPLCTIYFEEFGAGRLLLVLHGGYLDHRHMVDAIEPLFNRREGWKRIYIDLPGHGQSIAVTELKLTDFKEQRRLCNAILKGPDRNNYRKMPYNEWVGGECSASA